MVHKNRITNVFVAIIALGLHACVHSGSITEPLPAEEGIGPEPVVTVGGGLLATLSLESGVTLEFVDVGDDYVGIVERTLPGVPSVLVPTISKWAASPLEIYLAFKPANADTPKELVVDHKLQMVRAGKGNAPPRQLKIQLPGTAAPPVVEPFECGAFSAPWVPYWNDTFDSVTDSRGVDFKHFLIVPYTFYPGGPVYRGTGTNRITYLGACNGDDENDLGIEVHRWGAVVEFNPAPQPPTVTSQWLLVPGTTKFIGGEEKYLFYSGHPTGRYRARVAWTTDEGNPHKHLGIGAAWTKSFPLSIGF